MEKKANSDQSAVDIYCSTHSPRTQAVIALWLLNGTNIISGIYVLYLEFASYICILHIPRDQFRLYQVQNTSSCIHKHFPMLTFSGVRPTPCAPLSICTCRYVGGFFGAPIFSFPYTLLDTVPPPIYARLPSVLASLPRFSTPNTYWVKGDPIFISAISEY